MRANVLDILSSSLFTLIMRANTHTVEYGPWPIETQLQPGDASLWTVRGVGVGTALGCGFGTIFPVIGNFVGAVIGLSVGVCVGLVTAILAAATRALWPTDAAALLRRERVMNIAVILAPIAWLTPRGREYLWLLLPAAPGLIHAAIAGLPEINHIYNGRVAPWRRGVLTGLPFATGAVAFAALIVLSAQGNW
jgi:hypothetical protein